MEENTQSKPAHLFGFLLNMNTNQISHVIRNEEVGIVGLILAQVSGEIASSLLQKMEPSKRAEILVSMKNIDLIPLEVYRDIAERLSVKGADIMDMSKTASDGVDSILEVIDSLPLSLQFQYIHSISQADLELGKKLQSRFITLSEVSNLPDIFLSPIFQYLDKRLVLEALYHSDDSLKEKVLSNLPNVIKMMVTEELKQLQEITKQESEKAQRTILKKIREEIDKHGRPSV